MQTRNVAVCDKFGRRLKTYPIAIAQREDGPRDAEFATEALERAKADKLVPEYELDSLTIKGRKDQAMALMVAGLLSPNRCCAPMRVSWRPIP
jgi:hypothetical protein